MAKAAGDFQFVIRKTSSPGTFFHFLLSREHLDGVRFRGDGTRSSYIRISTPRTIQTSVELSVSTPSFTNSLLKIAPDLTRTPPHSHCKITTYQLAFFPTEPGHETKTPPTKTALQGDDKTSPQRAYPQHPVAAASSPLAFVMRRVVISSAVVGCIPTVSVMSSNLQPNFIAVPKPCMTSPALGPR